MTVSRPIGKNAQVALFKRETIEGTYVAPTIPMHFVSESMKYAPQSIEDPSNIGQLFTSDLIKTGYTVEGGVEMKAHPYFVGDALYWTLGKEDTVVNPVQGFLIFWYKGAERWLRCRKTGTTIICEKSTDGTTWVAETNFGTAGTYTITGLTLTQIATAIGAFTGYKATYVGYGASPIANLADWSNTLFINDGFPAGACIQPYLVTSTIAKMHHIYADPTVLTDLPSFSACIDRNFGATTKDIALSGCKITSLGITLEPKNLVALAVSMSAKVQANNATFPAGGVQASKAFATNMAKVIVDSLLVQDVKQFGITIANNFFKDESVGVDTFNSQGRQGATIDVSGTFNLTVTDATDEETRALMDKMMADTPIEIIMYLEGADYADLTNNAKYSVLVRCRTVKLSECAPVVSGPDRQTLPLAGKVVANQFGYHLDAYVTNKLITQY